MTRPPPYDAVIFDLLTALLNSWKLWNSVAGSDEAGLRWRHAYLALTYRCGAYQPYEGLVRAAAQSAGLPPTLADDLVARWDQLEPWDEAPDVAATLARRVPLGIATNCSSSLAAAAVAAVGVPFAAIVSAEEAGTYKPGPEPYLCVLKKLGVAPERALFVAGSAADVPGAMGVGMDVFWHNRIGLPAHSVKPKFMSARLDPLLDLV